MSVDTSWIIVGDKVEVRARYVCYAVAHLDIGPRGEMPSQQLLDETARDLRKTVIEYAREHVAADE